MKKEKEKEIILGIDLGTIYSCVGIMKNNVIILNDQFSNDKIIPSVVCFHDNRFFIGKTAQNLIIEHPESSLYESKRLIGLKYTNSHVQKDIKLMKPLKIIEDLKTKKPKYVIKVNDKYQEYFPEDVSSMILKYLKGIAITRENNNNIKRAVMAVPAHFNDLQREATVEAANKAGLEVIKLINEPTAAAIAYGVENYSNKERKVIIFDIGGGTFDVSIVKIKGNEYEVLGCDGEGHLGGEDFNQRLFDYVIEEIKKIDVFKNIDFDSQDQKILKGISKLKEKIELQKYALCMNESYPFIIENLFKIEDFRIEITKSKFEELCMDLWEKCINIMQKLIKTKKIDKKDINEIILVGGSTRIPKIQKMVGDFFGKVPKQNINPEEVVAYGATLAIHKKLIIKDTISKAIGILIKDKLSIIIPSGAVIPKAENKDFTELRYSRYYYIQSPNVTEFQLKIYEGNKENEKNLLKKYTFNVNKASKHSIKVSMIIKRDSMINVEIEVNEKAVKTDTFEVNFFKN